MKKLILGIIFIVSSIVGFSQSLPFTWANLENYNTIRVGQNLQNVSVYDSLEAHLIRIFAIIDTNDVQTDSLQSHLLKIIDLIQQDQEHNDSLLVIYGRLDALEGQGLGALTVNECSTCDTILVFNPLDSTITYRYVDFDNLGGSGTGTGDVKVDGTPTINQIPYWNGSDSTLAPTDNIEIYATDSTVHNVENIFHQETTFNDSIDYSFVYEGPDERPAAFSPTGKLKPMTLTSTIQIVVTDTLATASGETGYIFAIGSALDGYELISMEAFYGNSQGNRVPTITAYRNRSAVENNMTTAGANFTTDATINTSYDDVERGDRIEIRWVLGSGTTAPDGIIVQLSFQKP